MSDPESLCDVFDGQMWQHFQYDNGTPFLMAPHNYLLMLNCDWFQPFKLTQFSVGVLYIVLENLPQEIRFKRENVLIIGIIVSQVRTLTLIYNLCWRTYKNFGKVNINGSAQIIRAAISCLACDVPAARKVGGFTGHRATLGCSRCLKEFPVESFSEYPDYSGFDKSEWEPRSHALHVWYALKQKDALTKQEQKMIEAQHGARYSSLFELPYYHAIIMHHRSDALFISWNSQAIFLCLVV